MPGSGDFARVFANGHEITADSEQIKYDHMYQPNPLQAQNVGIKQIKPGVFKPTLSLTGFSRRGQGTITAHNLLSPMGIGSANDTEFIVTCLLGMNAAPAIGDLAVLFDGTLLDYKPPRKPGDLQKYTATFKSRGVRTPPFPILVDFSEAFKTATNSVSAVYDNGAESVGTLFGGQAGLQIYSPTGVVSTGTISLTGLPSDGDKFTLTIGGVAYVYVFKTSPSAATHVLIAATAYATMQNLFAAMTGSLQGLSDSKYFTGTTPIPVVPTATDTTALVSISVPSLAGVITLTALASGTAANAYTLVATTNVSTNLVVSGATMTGGLAGDTYDIKISSATSSGGSYTDLLTFSGVGATRYGAVSTVAVGTTINRFVKVTKTLVSGAGTSQTMAYNFVWGVWYQQ